MSNKTKMSEKMSIICMNTGAIHFPTGQCTCSLCSRNHWAVAARNTRFNSACPDL